MKRSARSRGTSTPSASTTRSSGACAGGCWAEYKRFGGRDGGIPPERRALHDGGWHRCGGWTMVSPEEMVSPDQARQLFGAEVLDADGAKVGTVTEVFLDDDTDRPSWVSVRTGWFGTNESLVPLRGAEIAADHIRVSYDKATIKAAPRSDDGEPLSRDDEGTLYRHYDAAGRSEVPGEPD